MLFVDRIEVRLCFSARALWDIQSDRTLPTRQFSHMHLEANSNIHSTNSETSQYQCYPIFQNPIKLDIVYKPTPSAIPLPRLVRES
jgi:hypothetical protein